MVPSVDNEVKEFEKKFQPQNIQGHEIYVQNLTQSFAFEHHFQWRVLKISSWYWVFNTTINVIMKKNPIQTTLYYNF
jgi:hypothetical protein